ncbi:MAG: fluoride efflux transporter CrcB [Gemmatimonadales bacterium]
MYHASLCRRRQRNWRRRPVPHRGIGPALFDTTFPAGTLLINISGSLLLGTIIRYAGETSTLTPELRALLAIGLCGGYTTFSSFSYETVALLEDGEWTRAALYVAGSVVLSLAATLLGFALAREVILWRERIPQ